MKDNPSTTMDLTSILMLITLAAVWGGTFFFAEIALTEIPPLRITFHRVAGALPFLILIVWIKKLPLPTNPKTWGAYLVMGALNNAIPFSLIFWGQTQISGGLASILNATTAMFAAVVAGILLKDEPLTTRKIVGAALGIFGVGIIMGPSALTEFNPANLAQLAVLAASLSYAFAGAWGKNRAFRLPSAGQRSWHDRGQHRSNVTFDDNCRRRHFVFDVASRLERSHFNVDAVHGARLLPLLRYPRACWCVQPVARHAFNSCFRHCAWRSIPWRENGPRGMGRICGHRCGVRRHRRPHLRKTTQLTISQ